MAWEIARYAVQTDGDLRQEIPRMVGDNPVCVEARQPKAIGLRPSRQDDESARQHQQSCRNEPGNVTRS